MKANLIKLNQIAGALGPLVDQKLPVKAAYWLNKLRVDVVNTINLFEKKRLELLAAYAETETEDSDVIKTDAGGKAIFRTKEDSDAFSLELDNLIKTEVDVTIKHLLTLGNLGAVEMTANDMLALGELFDVDPSEAIDIIDSSNVMNIHPFHKVENIAGEAATPSTSENNVDEIKLEGDTQIPADSENHDITPNETPENN